MSVIVSCKTTSCSTAITCDRTVCVQRCQWDVHHREQSELLHQRGHHLQESVWDRDGDPGYQVRASPLYWLCLHAHSILLSELSTVTVWTVYMDDDQQCPGHVRAYMIPPFSARNPAEIRVRALPLLLLLKMLLIAVPCFDLFYNTVCSCKQLCYFMTCMWETSDRMKTQDVNHRVHART